METASRPVAAVLVTGNLLILAATSVLFPGVLFPQHSVELAGRHAEAVAGFQPGCEICQNGSFFSDVNLCVTSCSQPGERIVFKDLLGLSRHAVRLG